MTPMILMLDDHTRAHLARAIDSHRDWCRVNALPVPPLFHQLSVALAASGGQARPQDATPLPTTEHQVMALTYDDAAAVLSVSPRSIRRLVAARELPAISIGGSKRITREALADYLKGKSDDSNDAA